MAFLMPVYDPTGTYGWDSQDILVSTPAKNYTVNDYQTLFTTLNFTNGYQMWLNGAKILPNLGAPTVEVMCIHGSELNTPGTIIYKTGTEFPDGTPEITNDGGDGTVNLRSLQGCQRFQKMQPQKFTYEVMPKLSHFEMRASRPSSSSTTCRTTSQIFDFSLLKFSFHYIQIDFISLFRQVLLILVFGISIISYLTFAQSVRFWCWVPITGKIKFSGELLGNIFI